MGFFVESEGFEPPDLLQSAVFKTAAIDHSASSLGQQHYYAEIRNKKGSFQRRKSLLVEKGGFEPPIPLPV